MTIVLIDGPVVMNRSELANQHVRERFLETGALPVLRPAVQPVCTALLWLELFPRSGISRSGDLSQLHAASATYLNS
jgi:hypothetical protein